jgi:hypothetical protein
LVPVRRRTDRVALVQRTLATITGRRNQIDESLHALRWDQRASVAGMPALAATAAAAFGSTSAKALPPGETVGRRGLRRGRRVLLSQRQLTFEVGDPLLGVRNLFFRFGQLSLTLGQFAAQALVFSLQPLAIVRALSRFPEHASHGTPIG